MISTVGNCPMRDNQTWEMNRANLGLSYGIPLGFSDRAKRGLGDEIPLGVLSQVDFNLSDESRVGVLKWDAGREGASCCTRGRVRSPGSSGAQRSARPTSARRASGFTLIELILVMMLIVVMASLVIPRLREFFEGRTLDAEVGRFVSLTHYAQSRAVSEGSPMVIWVDQKTQSYGLQQESGYTDPDGKALNYTVGEGLKISVGRVGASAPGTKTPTSTATRTGFHFSPDGNVIMATSVADVSIQEGKYKPVLIVPTTNGMGCEVQN
jgi:type II secretion system protein H